MKLTVNCVYPRREKTIFGNTTRFYSFHTTFELSNLTAVHLKEIIQQKFFIPVKDQLIVHNKKILADMELLDVSEEQKYHLILTNPMKLLESDSLHDWILKVEEYSKKRRREEQDLFEKNKKF